MDLSPCPDNKDDKVSQSSWDNLIDFTGGSNVAPRVEERAFNVAPRVEERFLPKINFAASHSHQERVMNKFLYRLFDSSGSMSKEPSVAFAPNCMSTPVFNNSSDQDYTPIPSLPRSPSLCPSPPGSTLTDPREEDYTPASPLQMLPQAPPCLSLSPCVSPVFEDPSGVGYMPRSPLHTSPHGFLSPFSSPFGSHSFPDSGGEDFRPVSPVHTPPSPPPLPSGSATPQDVTGEQYVSKSSPLPPPSPASGSQGSKGSFLLPKGTPRRGGDKKKNRSQLPVDFILYSPQKARLAPKLKVPKPYTPEWLLDNMTAVGIKVMDPKNKKKIHEFFKLVGGIHDLIQGRDKSAEANPGFIPGYDNILKGWIPKFAGGEIPSDRDVLELTDREVIFFFDASGFDR